MRPVSIKLCRELSGDPGLVKGLSTGLSLRLKAGDSKNRMVHDPFEPFFLHVYLESLFCGVPIKT